MTPSTTIYKPGDVVLVPFVFTDMSGVKNRPAVVVSDTPYHASRPDAVIMAITSRASLIPGDVALTDWAAAGLLRASYLKAVVQTVAQATISRRLGSLTDNDLAAVQACLRSILGL